MKIPKDMKEYIKIMNLWVKKHVNYLERENKKNLIKLAEKFAVVEEKK